jgi:hypothetical protein
MSTSRLRVLVLLLPLCVVVLLGCLAQQPVEGELHRWWSGLGPVVPHAKFPADCSLCHEGETWDQLRADFRFDHERETGVKLEGAHQTARCLRCHNDRGPTKVFAARGCVGCHADVHQGELGTNCQSCHDEQSWIAHGQRERHSRTRFPLTGAHAAVSCHRCHPGAFVGRFGLVDTKCATCHQDDVARTTNPPHVGLGWVDRCDRCHVTTSWNHAVVR